MFPRWHVLSGALFSLFLFLAFPSINWTCILLVFFGAVFIDFDHYMCAVMKTGKLGLKEAFAYHKRLAAIERRDKRLGLKKKSDFHIFHTLEFHIFVFILGLFWPAFMYLFIGMLFHSILDVIDMAGKGVLYRREFSLINWIKRKLKKLNKPKS